MSEVKAVVSTLNKIVRVDGRKLALAALSSKEISVLDNLDWGKVFVRASQQLVGDPEEVGYVSGVDVYVTVFSSNCVIISYVANRFSHQHHNDSFKYSTLVFTKVRDEWVEQVNTCLDDDTSELVIKLGDDLATEIRIERDDSMWPVYFLYPKDCDGWLELRLLLWEQDGSAIGSLMCSKDGPVKGHTRRIIAGLGRALVCEENLLLEMCKLRIDVESQKQ